MKNILPLLIVIILVIGGLQAVASPLDFIDGKKHLLTKGLENPSPLGDELDQQQPEVHNFFPVGDNGDEYWQITQSFVPSKEIVTRVELYIYKDINTEFPYEVAIRDSLTGENLAETSVPLQDIPSEGGWVEFDFDDIQVIPGNSYYIVSSTTDSEGSFYGWGWALWDLYPYGDMFYSTDGGETWIWLELYDMSFKTYGKDKLVLDLAFKSGVGVNLVIENIGSTKAEDIEYSITVIGGLLNLINISTDGIIGEIEAGDKTKVKTGPFFGLGSIKVTATAELYEIRETGFVFLFFVII